MSRMVALVAALAAFALVVPASSGNAQTSSGYSQGSGKSAKQKRRPTRVTVHPRYRGGYSNYPYPAVIGSSNPGAYPTSPGRYYGDPMVRQQSSFGPFDRGFFYDSGQFSPYGGWSPYYH